MTILVTILSLLSTFLTTPTFASAPIEKAKVIQSLKKMLPSGRYSGVRRTTSKNGKCDILVSAGSDHYFVTIFSTASSGAKLQKSQFVLADTAKVLNFSAADVQDDGSGAIGQVTAMAKGPAATQSINVEIDRSGVKKDRGLTLYIVDETPIEEDPTTQNTVLCDKVERKL